MLKVKTVKILRLSYNTVSQILNDKQEKHYINTDHVQKVKEYCREAANKM